MSLPATTVRVFGLYLLVLGGTLIMVPNPFLALFGIAATTDVWIRVVGLLAGLLGYYYLRAAAAELSRFHAWTVPARLSVPLFFGAFAAMGLAPPILLLFGAVDAAGALWTFLAIRRGRTGGPP